MSYASTLYYLLTGTLEYSVVRMKCAFSLPDSVTVQFRTVNISPVRRHFRNGAVGEVKHIFITVLRAIQM